MRMEHDASYKPLFSHARMMADLLQGFVHEAWVHDVDFSTLERVSDSRISDDLRSRRDDLIWRVRWGTDWLYIYLLLEFQSTVEASLENTRNFVRWGSQRLFYVTGTLINLCS